MRLITENPIAWLTILVYTHSFLGNLPFNSASVSEASESDKSSSLAKARKAMGKSREFKVLRRYKSVNIHGSQSSGMKYANPWTVFARTASRKVGSIAHERRPCSNPSRAPGDGPWIRLSGSRGRKNGRTGARSPSTMKEQIRRVINVPNRPIRRGRMSGKNKPPTAVPKRFNRCRY